MKTLKLLGVGLLLSVVMAESVVILYFYWNQGAMEQRITLLQEKAKLLNDLLDQEKRINSLHARVNVVCNRVISDTLVQLGITRPGGIGEAVVDALSHPVSGGIGGND